MSNRRIPPAYRIETERTLIRCFNPDDASMLGEAIGASLDHLRPWMPWAKYEPTDLEAKLALLRRFRGQFDLDQDYTYGIFAPDESAVIGGAGLHTRVGAGAFEIGYWVHAQVGGQGYATEISAALIRVAFEVSAIRRIEIHCDPANIRSARIPQKLGFAHEATLRSRTITPDGEPRDTMIWTLLAEEYAASPAAVARIQAFDALGRRIL